MIFMDFRQGSTETHDFSEKSTVSDLLVARHVDLADWSSHRVSPMVARRKSSVQM